jgi:protein gp37
MGKSNIEWTDFTWNPVRGCDKISPGCKHCYAETFAERWRGIKGHAYEQGFDLKLVPEQLDAPIRQQKPRLVFVNSMSDLFHEDVPEHYIAAVFGVMALACHHTYQVLTKRADRMLRVMENLTLDACINATIDYNISLSRKRSRQIADVLLAGSPACDSEPAWPLPNVRLGVSAENNETARQRIPLLRRCPAACHFVSFEPLLEDIDIHHSWFDWHPILPASEDDDGRLLPPIRWVIVGGESGPHARPFDLQWARKIRDRCALDNVAFFFKQAGARPMDTDEQPPDVIQSQWLKLKSRKGGDLSELPEDLRIRQQP